MSAGMRAVSVVRPEPVQVQVHDGRPTRFVWRGRLYTVIAIVERPGEAAAAAQVSEWAHEPDDHQHRPADWRCWRVSASQGKNAPAVGFRLCHDPKADAWLLSRDGS